MTAEHVNKVHAQKVLLLHGLWMSGYACWHWHHALKKAGFQPIVYSYPSVIRSMDQNAERLFQFIQQHFKRGETIHCVGHSMGGMLIAHMLRRHGNHLHEIDGLQWGRAVLCGSPINGSFAARTVRQWPLLGAVLGKSILDWHGVARAELPADLVIGIIAGTRNVGFGRVLKNLPQPSDGTVSLAETELKGGAHARITLDVTHSGLLFSPQVSRAIVQFLKSADFNVPTASAKPHQSA